MTFSATATIVGGTMFELISLEVRPRASAKNYFTRRPKPDQSVAAGHIIGSWKIDYGTGRTGRWFAPMISFGDCSPTPTFKKILSRGS